LGEATRVHARPRGSSVSILGRNGSARITNGGTEMQTTTQLLELTHDECLRLLAANTIGRLAISVADRPPLIRPVNYLFDVRSNSVIFRSARGSKFHALTHARQAAFEIDGHEPATQSGWSVIAVGPVEEVTNAAELARLDRSPLRPLAPGDAAHWMRIRTTVVSGRRIGPAQLGSASPPSNGASSSLHADRPAP
jgi:nitroimidazol reductase NimA-like FMN-containing flavoprotein (pyridoxamine 5'-phosphate oxidase superfamily)